MISKANGTDVVHTPGKKPAPAPRVTRSRIAIAFGSVATAVGLTYIRLYYGVDFTDEAFYTAVPYRFVLGAAPLVDETNIVQQSPALVLYPLMQLWNLTAGLDGIVLYARHLHLLFTAAVGLVLFASLKRVLGDRSLSAVLAAATVAFVPFGIHGLSYNSFSTGFFTAGCFLGMRWLAGGGPGLLAGTGAAHGLAMFTYPPFVLPAAFFFAALYFTSHPRSWRSLAPALLPAAAGAVMTFLFFMHEGWGTISDLVRRTAEFGDQGGGLGDLAEILSLVSTSFTHKYLAAVLLVAAAALRAWTPIGAALPLLLLPLAALPADLRTTASTNEFVTNAALLALPVFVLVRDSVVGKRLLAVVWLPAAVGGLTTAWSSANGGINVAIGFFPGLIVTGALIALAIRRATGATAWPIDLAPAVTLVAIGVALQYLIVYRDAGIRDLTVRVTDGAYAGLYTTPEKRDFLVELDRDLAAVSAPGCRIMFYDTFPAGYLLGHGVPATNATWLLDVDDEHEAEYQRLLLAYYELRGLPDVVVRVDRIPLSKTTAIRQEYGIREPFERTFGGNRYVAVRSSDAYRISRRRGATCGNP